MRWTRITTTTRSGEALTIRSWERCTAFGREKGLFLRIEHIPDLEIISQLKLQLRIQVRGIVLVL